MQLTFLGTAAADANPEPFCSCAHCEQARALGGPSLRKRSAALINDDLLIDLGPDVLVASMQHGRPLTQVQWCLQTHAHSDHLGTGHFYSRSPGYEVVGAPRLHFYASRGTLEHAAYLLRPDTAPGSLLDADVADALNLTLHTVAAGQAFEAGPYRVVAVTANHDPTVEPLLFAISDGARTVFYGTDTGPLPEAAWADLRAHRLRFDVVILDHTYGLAHERPQHMSARDFMATMARMREEGLAGPETRFVATHIAHPGNPAHPELVEYAAQRGYEVAYDGMVVEV
jgi:phosphoribosyl 1,2-cyclic phosphate phosphodiesterase